MYETSSVECETKLKDDSINRCLRLTSNKKASDFISITAVFADEDFVISITTCL